ncbi:MAG: ATP-binding protein, partial [Myxococcota bacterium]
GARGGTLGIGVSLVEVGGDDPDVPPGSYVVVRVEDDGSGLDAASAEKAFEPFFTTKGDDGTGLGLSMVYGFARQSGGIVRLDSEPERGTTATLLLPQYTGPAVPSDDAVETVTMAGGGELVLVVDDEPDVRSATVQLVRSLGYQTVEAGDASEALAILEASTSVQALMTDVVMPGTMDGRALAASVAQMHPEVAVLIVSGGAAPSGVGGNVRSLAKPYRRAELARALRSALVEADDNVG